MRQLLVDPGWRVSVYRIWDREKAESLMMRPKRGRRLWRNDEAGIRLRPERRNHLWSDDFVQDVTAYRRRFRMLTVIDEFTRHAPPWSEGCHHRPALAHRVAQVTCVARTLVPILPRTRRQNSVSTGRVIPSLQFSTVF
jgi:hypothetical protein